MPRPRIAIPTRLAPAGRPRAARRRRLAADAYCEAVSEAGGEPVRLAAPGPCAGLLIPGGPDFAPPEPRSYPPSVHFAAVAPEQLALDRSLLAAARAERRPVLGVCYGMQLIALECGGSLHYDLATDVAGAGEHRFPDRAARHGVAVEPGTRLALVFGAGELLVNSRHHQAVSAAGRGLRVSARALDGVIEALEAEDAAADPFLLGVQWHPEDLAGAHRAALYGAFVEAARRSR